MAQKRAKNLTKRGWEKKGEDPDFRSRISLEIAMVVDLVCFCCSFVVFDRLSDFLLVGIQNLA